MRDLWSLPFINQYYASGKRTTHASDTRSAGSFRHARSYQCDDLRCRQRPYFVEYTRSHPNSEVKRRKARSVLGWGTAREALRVLLAFCFCFRFLICKIVFAPVAVARRFPRNPLLVCLFNLPGWRWATIKQVALDRLSRSLHSDVCDSDGCNDVVVHSTISGREGRRDRASLNHFSINASHALAQTYRGQTAADHFFVLRCVLAISSFLRGSHLSRSLDVFIGTPGVETQSYLLGLLAMIKCSICSYQCDN